MADVLRFAEERLGHAIPSGASVLDFGCGDGRQVALLLDHGYDAWGVDIADDWDRAPVDRLKTVDLSAYRLPFADWTFDVCFSEQVMEHVTDYPRVFAEIARVLKPTGISIHRFPGPTYPFEGHVRLPFPFLCRSPAYLAACALAGLRRPGDEAASWREQLAINKRIMTGVRYPSKAALRRHAAAAGVAIDFVERSELAFRGGGRVKRVLDTARAVGLERPLLAIAGPILQRCMVLRPLGAATAGVAKPTPRAG